MTPPAADADRPRVSLVLQFDRGLLPDDYDPAIDPFVLLRQALKSFRRRFGWVNMGSKGLPPEGDTGG